MRPFQAIDHEADRGSIARGSERPCAVVPVGDPVEPLHMVVDLAGGNRAGEPEGVERVERQGRESD